MQQANEVANMIDPKLAKTTGKQFQYMFNMSADSTADAGNRFN